MGGISPLELCSRVHAGFPASSLLLTEAAQLKTTCMCVCVIMHTSLLLTVVPSRSSLEAETCTVPHKCGWSEPPLLLASSGKKNGALKTKRRGRHHFLHQEKHFKGKEKMLTQTFRLTLSSESAFSLSGGVSTGDTNKYRHEKGIGKKRKNKKRQDVIWQGTVQIKSVPNMREIHSWGPESLQQTEGRLRPRSPTVKWQQHKQIFFL